MRLTVTFLLFNFTKKCSQSVGFAQEQFVSIRIASGAQFRDGSKSVTIVGIGLNVDFSLVCQAFMTCTGDESQKSSNILTAGYFKWTGPVLQKIAFIFLFFSV